MSLQFWFFSFSVSLIYIDEIYIENIYFLFSFPFVQAILRLSMFLRCL